MRRNKHLIWSEKIFSHTEFAILLVIAAAFMHASWNAIVKDAQDRAVTLGLVMLAHLMVGLVMALIYPPPQSAAWPFLIGSTFVHCFYCYFLYLAYRLGDFSQVYPIARGIAPILISLGGYYFAGEVLGTLGWIAIFFVSFGIGLLVIAKEKTVKDKRAIYAALATGLSIAGYSVLDGLGARASGINTLGYIGYLFIFEGMIAFGFLYARRSIITQISMRSYMVGMFGGLISALAYGLVIYAKTLIELGFVSAIRESSVIIASLIGVVLFKERPWKLRVLAAIIVATGIAILAVYASKG